MKKNSKSVGLVAAGNLTGAALTRFWGLPDRLGPVKSPSFRLASRIANILKAGHAAKTYAEFNSCRLILVSVQEELLPKILAELLASGLSWNRKAIVLLSTRHDSSDLHEFSLRGAAVGSISPIPGFDELRYLVEGDRLAIREASNLVQHRGKRAIPIKRQLKPFYLAALTCTGTLLPALLVAASESLRHTGVPASFSHTILEKQLIKSFRTFVKGGRRSYSPPLQLHRQLRALAEADPLLADYLEQSCHSAARLIEKRKHTAGGFSAS